MTPAHIDRVFGRGRLKMVTGEHVEVYREEALPGERRRYTKRFLSTTEGDFRHWTEREWRILARLVGHGIGPVPDVVQFDRGASDRPALVQTYDAGITVDHWATLLPVERDGRVLRHVFEDCAHWWALARHCLVALDAIHELRLVHLDLKADNVCIPLGPAHFDPRMPGQLLVPLFPQIALIDFAFSLVSGEPLATALPIGRQAGYDYQSPRLLRALEAGRRGDLMPTRELDWRCDMFSLAAMLRHYLPQPERGMAGGWTRRRQAEAQSLVDRLFDAHHGPATALRPHRALIETAGAALRDSALASSLERGWRLASEAAVNAGAMPTPVTRIAMPVTARTVLGAAVEPRPAVQPRPVVQPRPALPPAVAARVADVVAHAPEVALRRPEAAVHAPNVAVRAPKAAVPAPVVSVPAPAAPAAAVAGAADRVAPAALRRQRRGRWRSLWWVAGVLAAGAASVPLLAQGWLALRNDRVVMAPRPVPALSMPAAAPSKADEPALGDDDAPGAIASEASIEDEPAVPAASAGAAAAATEPSAPPAEAQRTAAPSADTAAPPPEVSAAGTASASTPTAARKPTGPAPRVALAPRAAPRSQSAAPPRPAAPTATAKATAPTTSAAAAKARMMTAAKAPMTTAASPAAAAIATARPAPATRSMPATAPPLTAAASAPAAMASVLAAASAQPASSPPAAAAAPPVVVATAPASVAVPPAPAAAPTPAPSPASPAAPSPAPSPTSPAPPAPAAVPEAAPRATFHDASASPPLPEDFAERANALMSEHLPRIAQRAERLILRVLHVAAMAENRAQDEEVVAAASAVQLLEPERGLAGVPAIHADARRLHEAAASAFWNGRNAQQALVLQTRAFGADPHNAEIAGTLAFYLLKQRPAQAESARRLALHALTLGHALFPTGRVDDWITLAIASAITGRERDARNAFFVTVALTPAVDRPCRAAVAATMSHGERLRAPTEAMLLRIRAWGREQESIFCRWPPSWAARR